MADLFQQRRREAGLGDYSLGEAYLTHGDRSEAIRSYRRSLELNPQNANAWRNCGHSRSAR
jgi:cytochrome c-type biogenesis protein CcmH/NrfG